MFWTVSVICGNGQLHQYLLQQQQQLLLRSPCYVSPTITRYISNSIQTNTHTDTQTESVFALRSREKRVFIGTATVSSRCVPPLYLPPFRLTASLRARADCILTVKRVRLSVWLQVRVSSDSLTGLAPAWPMVAASTTTRRRTTTIATVTK